MLKNLLYKITNGRPMIDCGHNFIDCVSGESVRNPQISGEFLELKGHSHEVKLTIRINLVLLN